jgi:hypothetical protein
VTAWIEHTVVVVGAAISDVVATVSGRVLVIGNVHKTAVFGAAVAGAVGDGVRYAVAGAGVGAVVVVVAVTETLRLLWLLCRGGGALL